jgi:hypothetical protein
MATKYSINYIDHRDDDNTHYNQTINIKQKTLDKIAQDITNEIYRPFITKDFDHVKKMYFKTPFNFKGSLVFINLTQRDYVADFLGLKMDKRYLNRNTCLNIIDKKDTQNIINKAITAKCVEIRQILATYTTDTDYNTQILRQIGSIEATTKKAI